MAVLDSVPYISLKNTKWLYRGEGNANLVITIPQDKVILRLEKCNYGTKSSFESILKREKKLKMDVLFYKKIIVPFLGKAFIQPPFLGKISGNEVDYLDKELLSQRPCYRLNKGIQFEMVTIHPDYTYLPPIFEKYCQQNGNCAMTESRYTTFTVEIKPKQGWVYPSDRLHPKCTYCLNQYLKVKKKRVYRISQYCPLDLFSGNALRMKKALRNLLTTPQNNLKIFRDGQLIYSDESKGNQYRILKECLEPDENGRIFTHESLLDKWCGLITDALLRELTEEPPYSIADCSNDFSQASSMFQSPLNGKIKPCDWSTGTLPPNSILHRILTMQKLQNLPFLQLYEIYRQKKLEEEDYTYVEKLLNSSEPMGSVERYLLSTTAKDCSIFLAFHHTHLKTNGGLSYIQDCDGMLYQMNIGISDIDPKPLSCIEKHFKRDQDLVNTVLKHIEENKHIDAS